MGLNTLGLGIILSLRDGASIPAQRAAGALGQLDVTAKKFSLSFNSAMATAFEGMNLVAAGVLAASAPLAFVKATLPTQKAMAYIASAGMEEMTKVKEAAENFTNEWAGQTQEQFLSSMYEIKSGLYTLSDEAVIKMTETTGILAKATKSSMAELQELMPIMYGILRPSKEDLSDDEFRQQLAGGLAYAVKIYRATGKYFGDSFSQATGIATAEGIKMEEQFAILGQLQQTMTGAEAGTKMRALAVATPRAVEKAKKADIDIQLTDTKGMILPLVDIIKNVRNKYGEKLTASAMEQVRKMFGSREATSTIINLLPYIDKIESDSKEIAKAMGEGMPVAMEMAEIAANNMSDAWEIFAQRVDNLRQSIGEAFTPIFLPVMRAIGRLITTFQGIIKTIPFVVQLAGSVMTVVGVILIFTGALIIMGAVMKIINASILLMKSRLSLLKTEFVKLMITMWPFLVIAGLIYLAFKSNFMGIADTFNNLIASIKKFFTNVKMVSDALKELWSNFFDDKGIISEETKKRLEDAGLWEITKKMFMLSVRLKYLWEGIKQGFYDFYAGLVGVLKPIGKAVIDYVLIPIRDALAKVGVNVDLLNKIISPTQENADTWKEIGYWIGVAAAALAALAFLKPIIAIFTGLGKFVVGIFKIGKIIFGIGKIIWNVFMIIAGVVAGILGIPVWLAAIIVAAVVALTVLVIKFRKEIWQFLQWLWEKIQNVFVTIGGIIAGVVQTIVQIIMAIIAAVVTVVAAIAAVIGTIIAYIVGIVIGIATTIWGVANTIFEIWKGIWQAIWAVIKGIVDSIVAIVKAIFTGNFSELGETLKDIWGGVWDKIGDIVSTVGEKIKGIWTGISDFMAGIWNGIKNAASSVFEWIGQKFEWVGGLVSKIKDIWGSIGGAISSAWSDDKVPISVKGHARGGIFNGASIIGIGEQPGVNEAAIPLSGRYMIPFANAIAEAMPNYDSNRGFNNSSSINNTNMPKNGGKNGSGSGSNQSGSSGAAQIHTHVYLDKREIAKAVGEYVDQERRR